MYVLTLTLLYMGIISSYSSSCHPSIDLQETSLKEPSNLQETI